MSTFDTLLDGCKRQKQQAMLEIYNLCCNQVFNACTRIVSNSQDAEEIMQDAFLKAFDRIRTFSGDQKAFVSFVKTIAVNRSIDWYRKHQKEPFFTDVESEAEILPENDDEETYSIEKIKTAIEKLPAGYRMVLSLHLLDDMDFSDIALTMQVQASTVRSQYSRAREKLRERIKTIKTQS